MEEIKIGDYVSQKNGFRTFLGNFGLRGRVCRIDEGKFKDYDMIYFYTGNMPEPLVLSGKVKNSCYNWETGEGWEIKGKYRYRLQKGDLEFNGSHSKEELEALAKMFKSENAPKVVISL